MCVCVNISVWIYNTTHSSPSCAAYWCVWVCVRVWGVPKQFTRWSLADILLCKIPKVAERERERDRADRCVRVWSTTPTHAYIRKWSFAYQLAAYTVCPFRFWCAYLVILWNGGGFSINKPPSAAHTHKKRRRPLETRPGSIIDAVVPSELKHTFRSASNNKNVLWWNKNAENCLIFRILYCDW